MRICIVAAGRIKERGLRDMVDEYLARIRRHVPCEEIEVREGKNASEAFRAAIPVGGHVTALEVGGQQLDSVRFAQRLGAWGACGKGIVSFLIGGADGLPPDVSQRADDQLSLSRLTLAHRVARVVLVEQIYRATTIWRHEPYHR